MRTEGEEKEKRKKREGERRARRWIDGVAYVDCQRHKRAVHKLDDARIAESLAAHHPTPKSAHFAVLNDTKRKKSELREKQSRCRRLPSFPLFFSLALFVSLPLCLSLPLERDGLRPVPQKSAVP